MSDLLGVRAAQLIRDAVAGDLLEAEFLREWPEGANASEDFVNSRASVLAMLAARQRGDRELERLLSDDLADSAAALESGRKLEWFEVEPKWSKQANWAAIGVGILGYIASQALGWPWWSKWAPLAGAFALVWFAEWMWARR